MCDTAPFTWLMAGAVLGHAEAMYQDWEWELVLRAAFLSLCLSIGMTLVILGGGIDLSVGAILGLAGAVAAEASGDPSGRTDWIVLIATGSGAGEAHGVSLSYDDDEALTLDLAGDEFHQWAGGAAAR